MKPPLRKRPVHPGHGLWSALLCCAMLGGSAFAWAGPPVKKNPPADDAVRSKEPQTAEDEADQPKSEQKAVRKRIDARLRNHPFELDPNAKLVCEQTSVTAKPVWQGRDKLTFTFHLRNAGTADLKIKAKGG